MKTDRLIDILSAELDPAQGCRVERTIAWAAIVGGAAAFCLMLLTLPTRDLDRGADVAFLALKVAFGLSLVGAGIAYLSRSTRPGRSAGRLFALLYLPFAALGALALATVALPESGWGDVLRGTQFALCLICVPLFAIPPFVALTWAVRRGAPTDLTRVGAAIGIVAGASGAVAYAFACPDDAVPFIAVWYSVPIALCGMVGARLGPRLLRW